MRLALQNGAHLGGNACRLEWLAVVLQDLIAHGVAGFRAQVASELSGGIHLHADGALALLEDVAGLFGVEGKQILEVQLIRPNSGGIQLLHGLANHALGGTPAD